MILITMIGLPVLAAGSYALFRSTMSGLEFIGAIAHTSEITTALTQVVIGEEIPADARRMLVEYGIDDETARAYHGLILKASGVETMYAGRKLSLKRAVQETRAITREIGGREALAVLHRLPVAARARRLRRLTAPLAAHAQA
ncbi:MAG TPA: hypothetical protein VL551_34545 [Actinospica sp.]|nr:hypothetical protein [Actinospica sp.]